MTRWLCAACLCTSSALADDARPYGLERPTDFTLALTQQDITLERGSDRIDTTVKRIGFAWREHYGAYARLGLFGGYSYLTQSGEPLTAGEELDGYHAGLSVDFEVPVSVGVFFFAGARYLYEQNKDSGEQRDITLTWNVIYAETGVAINPVPAVRLYAGATYGDLDGDERVRGTVSATRDLSADDETGAVGGLEVTIDRDGFIGLVARSGLYSGAGIYFGRRF
jgi:hypothetical protein